MKKLKTQIKDIQASKQNQQKKRAHNKTNKKKITENNTDNITQIYRTKISQGTHHTLTQEKNNGITHFQLLTFLCFHYLFIFDYLKTKTVSILGVPMEKLM